VARLVLLVSIPSYPSTRMQGSSNPRVLSNRLQLHNQVLNNSTLVEHSIVLLLWLLLSSAATSLSKSSFLFLHSFLYCTDPLSYLVYRTLHTSRYDWHVIASALAYTIHPRFSSHLSNSSLLLPSHPFYSHHHRMSFKQLRH
jgi:hypothetical protein